MRFNRMAQPQPGWKAVAVPPSLPPPDQMAGLLQLGDDPLHGAFRNTHPPGHLA
jgi:hypothetical protein